MRATLIKSEQLTDSIRTYWFRPERPIHFVAGQFTELYLPHPHPDQRGQRHWFTISSSPFDENIAITTKFPVEHESTFKQTLSELRSGADVELAEPMGDFVLPKDPRIPLVFIGGGIGVTPFHSMCMWLQAAHEERSITLLYAVSAESDIIFKDVFETTCQKVTYVVTNPSPSWTGLTGHISAEMITELIPDAPSKRLYLSGPEPMVEALGAGLQAHGINKDDLVIDYFPGYSPV